MRKSIFCILFFVSIVASGQIANPSDSLTSSKKSKRQWLVGTATVAGYGGSFIFLNEAWYAGYPRSSFHTFNDAGEWLQMDKTGHAWTAYHTGRLNTALWRWAGANRKTAVLLGSGTGLFYMLSIEYLDGRSAEWGWSWPDAGADIFGSSLFAGQELAWKDQKISIKFSSLRKNYQPASLEERANNLFGRSIQERLLKDYNAQTYWLSGNLSSIFKGFKVPSWLNLAVGYGAEGMFGGYDNIAFDKNGNVSFDRRDIKRYRQWYLAPDIDLTRIKTENRFLKTVFAVVNMVKVPTPAIEFSNGRLKGHWLAF
ncbi:MAG: DUF2279 domain-containing protein [Flavisolibacter sp.]